MALFKAALILSAAVFVLAQVVYAALHPGVPVFEAMGTPMCTIDTSINATYMEIEAHADRNVLEPARTMRSTYICRA